MLLLRQQWLLHGLPWLLKLLPKVLQMLTCWLLKWLLLQQRRLQVTRQSRALVQPLLSTLLPRSLCLLTTNCRSSIGDRRM